MLKKIIGLFFLFHSFVSQAQSPTTHFENQKILKKITLGLNWKAEPQFGGFYQAQVKKLYEKNNLSVEILEGGSGTPTVQMLSHDKLDYGIVSAEELLISNEKNPATPLVALYAVYKTNPQMIMTHAERNFKALKDVFQTEGILALQQGLSYAQYLKKAYQPIKVNLVPYLGGIANFQTDKKYSQQGFVNSEDLLAEKKGLKTKIFLVADSGFNPYTTVLATQLKRLKTNKEEVNQMISSVRHGWSDYLNSPSEANLSMTKINKAMDIKTMNKAALSQKALIDVPGEKLGEMKSDRWEMLQTQLSELKILKRKSELKDYYFHE